MTHAEAQILAEWKADLADGIAGTDADPYVERDDED